MADDINRHDQSAAAQRGEVARPSAPAPFGEQSIVLDTVIGWVFHSILVLSVYLHFAGHNQPGGGFIAGLVAGAALVLRFVSGSGLFTARQSVTNQTLLGVGIVLVVGTAMAGLVLGNSVLEHHAWTFDDVPVLGNIKLTSALFFDTGIYLVVVGMMGTLLAMFAGESGESGESGADEEQS
jgi:multicomponent Na+:H+ antiporter subunit A